MKHVTTVLTTVVTILSLAISAWASDPQFPQGVNVTRVGDTLLMSGHITKLGGIDQIAVTAAVLAQCVNPADDPPSVQHEMELTAGPTFPRMKGKTLFGLGILGGERIVPACTSPNVIVYRNLEIDVFEVVGGVPVGDPILTYADPGPF